MTTGTPQTARLRDQLTVYPEPPLEFQFGQAMADPHDGSAMFGPYDADLPSHPKNISYALIGTTSGSAAIRDWSRSIQAR